MERSMSFTQKVYSNLKLSGILSLLRQREVSLSVGGQSLLS